MKLSGWLRFSLLRGLLVTVAAALALVWFDPWGSDEPDSLHDRYKLAADGTRFSSEDGYLDSDPWPGHWYPHELKLATWDETRKLLAERDSPRPPAPTPQANVCTTIQPFETKLVLVASYGQQVLDFAEQDIVLVRQPRQLSPLAELLEGAPVEWEPSFDFDGAQLLGVLRRAGLECQMEPLEAFEFLQTPFDFHHSEFQFQQDPISLDQQLNLTLAERDWRYEVLPSGRIRISKRPPPADGSFVPPATAVRWRGGLVLVEWPAAPYGEASPEPLGWGVAKGARVWTVPVLWWVDAGVIAVLLLVSFADRIAWGILRVLRVRRRAVAR